MTTAVQTTDLVVIGGGVVGLAVAARLARAGLEVVVLERHPGFGRETSSRNSEVIHAGMYYPTGSLKARMCVAGNRRLYEWCAARGVPHRRVGKFIVATTGDEVAALEGIAAQGAANGVPGLGWATERQLRTEEPHVRAHAALWSPDTGIVDSHALMASLVAEAEVYGAAFAWRTRFRAVDAGDTGFEVRYTEPDGGEERIRARRVVNAAGLAADEIAAAAGIDVDAAGYRLQFVKGSYFRLTSAKQGLCRHLVYPIPHHGLTGLGIHVTVDLAGSVRLGPNVEPLAGREQRYTVDASLAAPFAAAVSRYLPGITADDLRPDQAGIRPRRVVPGGGVPDFLIAEESAHGLPGWVNLVGIESPGLTCCLEIADRVAELIV